MHSPDQKLQFYIYPNKNTWAQTQIRKLSILMKTYVQNDLETSGINFKSNQIWYEDGKLEQWEHGALLLKNPLCTAGWELSNNERNGKQIYQLISNKINLNLINLHDIFLIPSLKPRLVECIARAYTLESLCFVGGKKCVI